MYSDIAVTNKHTAKLHHVGSLYILTYDARKLKHKRRRRRSRQLLDVLKEKGAMEVKRGSTRSHCAEKWFSEWLWPCHKTLRDGDDLANNSKERVTLKLRY